MLNNIKKIPKFNFIGKPDAICYEVWIDDAFQVLVVTDRNSGFGGYEYLICENKEVKDFSDCGYGRASFALKDALNFYFKKYEESV